MKIPHQLRSLLDGIAQVEEKINSSTFGRVFRLEGSGDVGQESP